MTIGIIAIVVILGVAYLYRRKQSKASDATKPPPWTNPTVPPPGRQDPPGKDKL